MATSSNIKTAISGAFVVFYALATVGIWFGWDATLTKWLHWLLFASMLLGFAWQLQHFVRLMRAGEKGER
jgi:hypothetical protein